MKFGPVKTADAEGALLAHSYDTPKGRMRKGQRLDAAGIARLLEAGHQTVIVARLAPDDTTLFAAPGRIAEAAWLGDDIHYEVTLDAGPRIRVLRPTTEPALPPGTAVTLAAGADAITFLDDFGDTP